MGQNKAPVEIPRRCVTLMEDVEVYIILITSNKRVNVISTINCVFDVL